jgi:hypothetical protein
MMVPFDKSFVGPLWHAGAQVARKSNGKVHPFVMCIDSRADGSRMYYWNPLCSCPGTANGWAKPRSVFHWNKVNCRKEAA